MRTRVGIGVVAMSLCVTGTADATETRDTGAVIHGFVADGAPGAMAYVRDGRATWWVSSGTREVGTHRPIRPRDRVRVASNTKMFTAAVVLQLVAEGRLGLDDPVERHLPGLVAGTGYDGDAITVRQLLQHTSGMADYVQDVLADPDAADHPWEAVDLVHIGLSHPPLFAPGTGWGYSNTGYLVLGMIVEAVTGTDIGTEITERLIEPLHLRDTSYPSERTIPGPHAHGYFAFPGQPVTDVTELEPSIPGAAAALISTGPDLTRFVRALLDGRVLPPAQLARMRTTVPAEGPDYGLGIRELPLPCGGVAWGHAGNVPGFDSFTAATDDGRSVFVVVNGHLANGSVADVRQAAETALCE